MNPDENFNPVNPQEACLNPLQEPLSLTEIFIHPMRDKDLWWKLIMVTLIGNIPFIGWVYIMGYTVEYLRNIITRRDNRRLPKWGDMEICLSKGWKPFIAYMVFSFILFLITLVVFIPFMGNIMNFYQQMISSINTSDIQRGDPISMGDPQQMAKFVLSMMPPILIASCFALYFFHLSPILLGLYAEDDRFVSLLDIARATKMVLSDVGYFSTVTLGFMAFSFVVILVIILVCFIPVIGWILSLFLPIIGTTLLWIGFISAYGEFYYKTRNKVE